MGLYLRSLDLARLDAVFDVLLAPYRYADSMAWCADAAERIITLFGGDHGVFGMPCGAYFAGRAANMPDEIIGALLRLLASSGPKALRGHLAFPSDELADQLMERVETDRERSGIEVWSRVRSLIEASRRVPRGDRVPFIGEVSGPGRIRDSDNIDTTIDGGYIAVCVSYEHAIDEHRRSDSARRAAQPVLRLLLPAVKAGVRAWMRRDEGSTTAVTPLAEPNGTPALAVAGTGQDTHVNDSLRELLDGEPDAPRVLAEMRAAATFLPAVHDRQFLAANADHLPYREIATARSRYRIVPFQAPGTLGDDGAVVTLTVVSPPSTHRYQQARAASAMLTAREQDVARLLAKRATNAEIALALGLSRHTVRHHIESLFAKLGVHSRRDVARHLPDYGT